MGSLVTGVEYCLRVRQCRAVFLCFCECSHLWRGELLVEGWRVVVRHVGGGQHRDEDEDTGGENRAGRVEAEEKKTVVRDIYIIYIYIYTYIYIYIYINIYIYIYIYIHIYI